MEKKAKANGRKLGTVETITGDLCKYIKDPKVNFAATGKSVVFTSNMLLPKSVTCFMSERFRTLPPGVRILCFDDVYPHCRESARNMDPEAFRLFDMEDYTWPVGAVEWCVNEGPFFVHRRTKHIKEEDESA